MPSQEHEIIVDLIRQRPAVVVSLLRAADVAVAPDTTTRVLDASFAALSSDYRADVAVALDDALGTTKLAVVVEVQLGRDGEKRWSWPAYETVARARHRVDACVLVLAPDPSIAEWSAQPMPIGPSGSRFVPVVAGPDAVPWVFDEDEARAQPELAVLSALAHGNAAAGGLDVLLAAMGALSPLHEDRAKLYLDLIDAALTEATRGALEALMDLKNYEYKGPFARRYVAEGRAAGREEGKAEGKAESILSLVAARGLALTEAQRQRVLACREIALLEEWFRRAVTAATVDEILAST